MKCDDVKRSFDGVSMISACHARKTSSRDRMSLSPAWAVDTKLFNILPKSRPMTKSDLPEDSVLRRMPSKRALIGQSKRIQI